MSTSRRSLLQLAAAAAGAATAPFAVSPERAAALLAEPAAFDPGPGRGGLGLPGPLDPVRFAESIDGTDWDFKCAFADGCPEEMAAYNRAMQALIDLAPGFLGADAPGGRAVDALDEAALDLWSMAWMAGVRAGVGYEHLRQALVTPTMMCSTCQGKGRTWGGKPYRRYDDGANEATCGDCNGAGTVPTPPPTLALAAD